MLLKGQDGSEFAAIVVAYEFPHIEHHKWDSNWLLIAMRVQSPLGAGKCVEPCLTTWDAERLITWLEARAQASPTESDICFLEPNLGFEIRKVSGSLLTLRVHFILGCGAFWKPVNGKRYRRSTWKSFVDLEITPAEIQSAADAWRADLRKFPLREW